MRLINGKDIYDLIIVYTLGNVTQSIAVNTETIPGDITELFE